MFMNMGAYVFERAQLAGSKTAFEYVQDGKIAEINYSTIFQKSATIAQILLKKTQPGNRILLIYPPGLEFITAFIACTLSGMIAVPCYPPVNQAFSNKLALIIQDCKPSLALTTRQIQRSFFMGRFFAGAKKIASHMHLNILGNINLEFFKAIKTCDIMTTDTLHVTKQLIKLSDFKAVSPDQVCFLQYTSGTTESTKGVMVTHSNIIMNLKAMKNAYGLNENITSVFWEPHYHDMGLIAGILLPIYVGFKARLMSPFELLRSPVNWLKNISETHAFLERRPNFCLSTVPQYPGRGFKGIRFFKLENSFLWR